MPSLAEIRQQYPQYADMPDADLAKALHAKHYSDLDFNEFSTKIGYTPPEQPGRLASFGSWLGRQGALGGRAVAEGAMDLVSPFADLAGLSLNAALPGQPFETGHSQAFSQALTDKGVPAPTRPGEGFSNIASRVILGFAGGRGIDKAITGAMGAVPAVVKAPTPARSVLAQAQREGMVVPPAQAAPRSFGAFLEGAGGTLKTGQQAAAVNQPIINTLAARAVGVTDEALTPETLQGIRTQAGEAYRVIRGSGTITTGADFIKKIASAAQPFRSTQRSFPVLAKANDELIAIADDVAKNSFDADDAVNAIQMLRDKASAAYRGGMSQQGSAYKAMASALEGSIESHLTSQGSAGEVMLQTFRNARQLIAKTHTVEDALRGSNVDINALGRMLKSGVPMTDELRLLGQFSQHYPGAANLTAALKARPAFSVLDAAGGASSIGAALAFQSPELALPALALAARPAARGAALSPFIQRGLLRSRPPVPWSGLIGGAPAGVHAVVNEEQY